MTALDDLWRLAYFTGKPVTLRVVGGRETWHEIVWNEISFNADSPADCEQIRMVTEEARKR